MIADEEDRISKFERLITAYEGLISAGWADRTDDLFEDGGKGTIKERKENLERVMPARRGNLNKMKDEYAMKKQELDSVSEPVVTDKLMMLNLIKVI